jgi:hypothetical protein
VTHHLLGTPTLESLRLERKTAAVLEYLALEGLEKSFADQLLEGNQNRVPRDAVRLCEGAGCGQFRSGFDFS